MARSKKPKIGDVFEAVLHNNQKGYLQYIGNDLTQLNSDVIRVFKKRYPAEANPSLEEVLSEEVNFYSHVTGVEFGEKDGVWRKVGNSANLGDLKLAFFRDAADELEKRENGEWGMPKVSRTWKLWRMNEPMRLVDQLEGENIKAYIGLITQPKFVIQQMQTGEWPGFYPSYK